MKALSFVTLLAAGLMLTGCKYETISDPSLSGRDLELMALTAPAPKDIDPQRARYRMPNPTTEREPGTVVVDSNAKFLYLVEPNNLVLRYPIAVGQDAYAWTGEAKIGKKVAWPSWTPGKEARQLNSSLPATVPGGAQNPLGARALYLFDGGKDTEYRIHGTNEPESIGQNVSLGCIRMYNIDVIDLFNRVKDGARVVVY